MYIYGRMRFQLHVAFKPHAARDECAVQATQIYQDRYARLTRETPTDYV